LKFEESPRRQRLPLVSRRERFSFSKNKRGTYMEKVSAIKKPTITLRTATLADVALLRRWDEQPHVVESDPNDEWGWETELGRTPDWREQLIAEVDGRPIGFVQIIDPAREDSRYWGDAPADLRAVDIWIGEAEDLGKGYGTQIMRQVLTRCFADPSVTAVLLDPLANNVRSHHFYERLGFRFVERRQFGQDDCFVYQLTRTDWERRC
jgi:aminoglycoside 6'-N-acetyltransferase